jgi:serine/threonine protein kinase
MPADSSSISTHLSKFHEGLVLNNRYSVLDTLNQGSYGIVLLARDSQSGRNVAIKCLAKPNDAFNDGQPSVYQQELHFHSHLADFEPKSPGADNIVRCLDTFETAKNAFLVLEYCDLGDLYENIMQGRIPRDTQTVKDILLQLVNAVQYCHDAGVYHRDIKPENVLMSVMDDGSGRPLLKLGDFGLATHDHWATDVGTGSDRYMAPEQYENVRDGYCPEKADIWAVGCCLLNLVFSRNPFKVPSTTDLIFADYVRDPMSLCDVFPDMSNDTFEVLRHSLTIDPAKRDLNKVREALENLVNWTDAETAEDEHVQTDFTCYAEEPITCTGANRAPLRTPSLAHSQPFFSGTVDGTPFPWAAALKKQPTIEESESEDDEDTEYFSDDAADTASSDNRSGGKLETDDGRSSDSGLGTSLGSLYITPPTNGFNKFNARGTNNTFLPTPPSSIQKPKTALDTARATFRSKFTDISSKTTSSSVPISTGRGILGKYINDSTDKLKFGKSWSDWVEEEEEEERMSRGDSRASTGSSSGLSFSETNEDDGGWWEGVPTAHGWDD